MAAFQIQSPEAGAAFAAGSIIEAHGSHTLEVNSSVWAILSDTYGHYYLQNPPVTLSSRGTWHVNNIHLGHDIVEILFVKVNTPGHNDFLRKVKRQEWGAFDQLPAETEIIGRVSIRV